MRNSLRRYYGRGDLHFLTFSCYRRLPLLGTARARDRFVKILDQVRGSQQFQLLGYVVMPEHVHLLISEPRTGNPSKSTQSAGCALFAQTTWGAVPRPSGEHRASACLFRLSTSSLV